MSSIFAKMFDDEPHVLPIVNQRIGVAKPKALMKVLHRLLRHRQHVRGNGPVIGGANVRGWLHLLEFNSTKL